MRREGFDNLNHRLKTKPLDYSTENIAIFHTSIDEDRIAISRDRNSPALTICTLPVSRLKRQSTLNVDELKTEYMTDLVTRDACEVV